VNKEFLIFLFFLALSGGFWLLATLNETYEKDFYVPVHITNIPKNVVITTNEEDTVRVTLRDKGFTIMAYLYSHKLQPVLINYGSYARKKAGKGVIPIADIQKHILEDDGTGTQRLCELATLWVVQNPEPMALEKVNYKY